MEPTNTKKVNQTVIPKHLQIETINGVCNARCIMCTIDDWDRKLVRMSQAHFEIIIRKFFPYRKHIDLLTLHGDAEPLLDTGLEKKVSFAQKAGFRGIGFATNANLLNKKRSERLLEAGLDTLICSIDGLNKETHEAIRLRTNFTEIVENVRNFICLRNSMDHKCRVFIRFIRQELNYEEWPAYCEHWNKYINRKKGDDVLMFPVHNWAGKISGHEKETYSKEISMNTKCSDVFENMSVLSNGDVRLCCVDYSGFHELGNVIREDPIEIYNNEVFARYRNYMNAGRLIELDNCRNCTVIRSHANKTIPDSVVFESDFAI